MTREIEHQTHYLALGKVRKLTVQKRTRREIQPIHLETVELSQAVCCFECEGEQVFHLGEELHFDFDLGDRSLNTKGTVLMIEKCDPVDQCYDPKGWSFYCARFDTELDRDFFELVAGTPRRANPLLKLPRP